MTQQIGPGMYQQYHKQVRCRKAGTSYSEVSARSARKPLPLPRAQRPARRHSVLPARRPARRPPPLLRAALPAGPCRTPAQPPWLSLTPDMPHAPRPATTQVCEDCPNVKYERESESLTVSVEPGMPDGHTITFFEEGEPILDGEAAAAGGQQQAAAASRGARGPAGSCSGRLRRGSGTAGVHGMAACRAALRCGVVQQPGVQALPAPVASCQPSPRLACPPQRPPPQLLPRRRARRPARRAAHSAAPQL